MRILIYDRNENYKCGLSDLEKAVHEEELNGKNILKFSLLATTDGVQHLEKNGRVLYKDRQGYWQEFILREIKESHANNELIKEIYCEHSFYETLGDYVEDKRPYDVPANTALADALLTTRWEVGIVHDLGINSTNFYHISAKEAVQKVAEAWEGELRYRVEVAGTKITHRYVDLLARRGADRGKRYEYTKDLLSIIRTVRRDDVITALYGYGKGEEIEETGGYGRRITFEDVEWSVANGDPIEKPLGQTWVGDPEVLEQWGRPNGDGTKAHIFDKVEFDQIEEPGELLRLTWEEYQKRSQVQVSYEGKVADLKTIDGLEHEGVELGDTVAVIDKEFNPPLRVKARVLSYKADLLDPSNDEVVLGNFIDDLTSELRENIEHIDNLRSRSGVWDRSNAFNPDGTLNAQYLESLIDELNAKLNSMGGYVFLNETGDGIITCNAPDLNLATMAVQILGGAIRIANEKNPDGTFKFRTFITGKDITADLINTGILKGGKVNFDLTNGTLLIGDSVEDFLLLFDGSKLYLNGLGIESYATKIYVDENISTVIEISTEEPVDPVTDKVWLDISGEIPLWKRYNGTEWEPCQPLSLYELDPDAQESLDSHNAAISIIETGFVQLEDSIGTKVSQTDYDEFGNLINQQISAVEQTQDAINMEFSQISENITDVNGEVEQIKTGIRFDEDGMHIGKSDSPLQMTLSNEQLGFLDNGLLVAYVNGQKLYITMAEILESLVVGNHKIEKYDENITLVRWVG
jgi:phage minor structural protein